jgi:hypothetical protein
MTNSNSNPSWTDSDGIELKRSRESAGNDVYSFARQNNLSTYQLLELEEGGKSYFYTTTIKYNVGKKLLNSLGEKTDYQRLVEIEKSKSIKDAEVVETFLNDSTIHLQPTSSKNISTPKKLYIFVTAVTVILISCAFVIYPNKSNRILDTSQTPVVSQVNLSALPANTESISSTADKRNSLEESKSTKATATATATANSSNPNECRWTDNSKDIRTTTATKEGNYVYLVALNELVVCIKDANNIQTTVLLKPDQSQNIAATPPIKIYSANLNNVNIFYQGSKIQLPEQSIKEITLLAQQLK